MNFDIWKEVKMYMELVGVALLALLNWTGTIDIHWGWIVGFPFLMTFTHGFLTAFLNRLCDGK